MHAASHAHLVFLFPQSLLFAQSSRSSRSGVYIVLRSSRISRSLYSGSDLATTAILGMSNLTILNSIQQDLASLREDIRQLYTCLNRGRKMTHREWII